MSLIREPRWKTSGVVKRPQFAPYGRPVLSSEYVTTALHALSSVFKSTTSVALSPFYRCYTSHMFNFIPAAIRIPQASINGAPCRDGRGRWSPVAESLPRLLSSVSCVVKALWDAVCIDGVTGVGSGLTALLGGRALRNGTFQCGRKVPVGTVQSRSPALHPRGAPKHYYF